jgi:hypothetical protein
MPISEMSILRSPLINKLYALLVLKSVLKDGRYKKITLILDDPLLEISARRIAGELSVEQVQRLNMQIPPRSHYRRRLALTLNWWRIFFLDFVYWMLLHVAGKWGSPESSDHVLGLTIFPTLWEENRTNRAFGDIPDELKRHGHGLFYLALPTMRLRDLIISLKHWRTVATRNRMVFVHSYVRFVDVLRAYLRSGWGFKLADRLRNIKPGSFQIDRIDVTELLHRELVQEAWDTTIPQSILLAQATQAVCTQTRTFTCALHAFEFQPVEKAFTLGVKLTDSRLPVIGLQTSLIGKNHLGYRFLPEHVRSYTGEIQPSQTPLPDYVATYGTSAHNMLEKLLGRERVAITGPVRYPYLRVASDRERRVAEKNLKQRLNTGHEVTPILLALTSLQGESESIMNWALKIGRDHPGLFFLVRFHYWVDLSGELQAQAAQLGFTRYKIVQEDLHQQLLACPLIITGTSSIGVEAMVSGCMPVVYRSNGKYAYGPVDDVAEGVYFFSNEAELELSVRDILQGGRGYRSRRARWPKLLEKHCYKLDGRSSSRLYAWLNRRRVFNSSTESRGDV